MNIDLTLSTETEVLLNALRAVPIGGEISYVELTKTCGRNVTSDARSRLATARRIALRDTGICFTVVRGVGLRRITLDEAPGIGAVARSRIRSTAKRATRGMRAVLAVSNGATPETGRRISAEINALGLIAEISGDPAQKAFETDQPVMPPALAGQAFLKHIGAVPDEGAAA